MQKPAAESTSLVAGALSALGASACCVLPLALVSVGLGGAWVARLRSLERFYPVFVGVAIAAFAYAFYRLYLKASPCGPDGACISPKARRNQRIAFWVALVAAKLLILSPYIYAYLSA